MSLPEDIKQSIAQITNLNTRKAAGIIALYPAAADIVVTRSVDGEDYFVDINGKDAVMLPVLILELVCEAHNIVVPISRSIIDVVDAIAEAKYIPPKPQQHYLPPTAAAPTSRVGTTLELNMNDEASQLFGFGSQLEDGQSQYNDETQQHDDPVFAADMEELLICTGVEDKMGVEEGAKKESAAGMSKDEVVPIEVGGDKAGEGTNNNVGAGVNDDHSMLDAESNCNNILDVLPTEGASGNVETINATPLDTRGGTSSPKQSNSNANASSQNDINFTLICMSALSNPSGCMMPGQPVDANPNDNTKPRYECFACKSQDKPPKKCALHGGVCAALEHDGKLVCTVCYEVMKEAATGGANNDGCTEETSACPPDENTREILYFRHGRRVNDPNIEDNNNDDEEVVLVFGTDEESQPQAIYDGLDITADMEEVQRIVALLEVGDISKFMGKPLYLNLGRT